MTIHSEHPFRDPTPDPARQLRARLGGAVTLWTAGSSPRAGLTVSSLMVAGGDPGRVLALLDPDSDLRAELGSTGRGVVHLLGWEHRQLAEAFAGQFPAPGGPFTLGEWEQTSHGPRLVSAPSLGPRGGRVVSLGGLVGPGGRPLGTVSLGDDDAPLVHRRGRYLRPDGR